MVKSTGDHNALEVVIRVKGTDSAEHDTKRRDWKSMDMTRLNETAKSTNCDEIMVIENLDLANNWLVEKINELLEAEAPWKTIQYMKNHIKWVSTETKIKMEHRDKIREEARKSGCPALWKLYREKRN